MPPPADMSDEAKAIWQSKVQRYRQRGQKTDGCQDALRQYCELEAALIEAWKAKRANMAMVSVYRTYANDFYDTPASQRIILTAGKDKNPFAKNGKFGISA